MAPVKGKRERVWMTDREVIALQGAVQMARAVSNELRDFPDGEFAQRWHQVEIEEGGEIVSQDVSNMLDDADALTNRISKAAGVPMLS